MQNCVVTLCTCGSREEAERLATILVEERLAACVSILPTVLSVYRWQGKVETASEHLLFVKTTEDRHRELERRIGELHSYDTPEVISMAIVSGSKKYLTWLAEQVSPGGGGKPPV
jgi:periplasmic divalent cation tolerance protein